MKEQDLSANARTLFLKAKQANEIGNYGYVIQLLQPVLKEAPGFLDGRKLSRAAAIQQNKGKKAGGMSLSGSMLGMTASSTLKKDPLAAIEIAEKTLEKDPYSSAGNQLLFEAATKAGLPDVAAFALETLASANQKDTKILHQLAAHYEANGQNDRAVNIYSRIVTLNPTDLNAIKKSKDASATATMKSGGWQQVSEKGGSFRDLMKSKDEAIALENKARTVRTEEQISQQVAEVYAQWEGQQSNIDHSRRLANLYEQWFEVSLANNGPAEEAESYLDNAIWYFSHTNTLLNGGDANIARKKTDLEFKKVDRRIKVLEDWLAQVDAEHPDVKPYADELTALRDQRNSSTIETARKRVSDNPTDLLLRYELGEVLKNAGKVTEAVPELQRARQNPNVRLKAMNLLGQCFVEKGMNDLAVVQFKTAASEITAMDTLKKDVLYQLGLVYEKMGKREEYLDCLKQIYEADYGYRDVAQRVESSYGG